MKIFKFVFLFSISLSFGSIQADDFECKELTGTVQLFPAPGDKCPILKKKARHFPDLIFLHELGFQDPPSCFVGWVEGDLDKTPINGKAVSGLTANTLGLDPAFLTAASAIKFNDAENGKLIGIVFTQDLIIDPNGGDATREYLAMVGGTKNFKGGKGHLEIFGNVFSGTTFSGTVCVQD